MELVSNPQFVVKGTTRFDLDQGFLGDCWFLAAASTLCLHDSLFKRVVPEDQTFSHNYGGLFRFNFWWYGKWKEIVVDDLLPTDGYRLIYCRNREQPYEFWSALFEKAYAKLRGCYEGINGGKIQDALVDFTGGITEWFELSDRSKLPDDLYELIYRSFHMNSLIGCNIFGQGTREERMANGLYTKHAYSITGVAKIPRNVREVKLLRIRNPHGKGEWNGAWSDKSPEILASPVDIKQKLDFMNLNDGEFWMSYEDWIQQFDEVEFCHLTPDNFSHEEALSSRKYQWNVTVYHDSWIRGVTAGGCGNGPYEKQYWQNPQFFVRLKQADGISLHGQCTLIVSLMEKEKDARNKYAIGFQIYRLKDQSVNPTVGTSLPPWAMQRVGDTGQYIYNRECTARFDLPAGRYVVIPTTFKYNDATDFMLRFFTEKQFESGYMGGNRHMSEVVDDDTSGPVSPPTPVEPEKDYILELYKRHAKGNQKMDPKELRNFLNEILPTADGENVRFHIEAARSLHVLFDKDKDGYITYEEAKNVYKETGGYIRIFHQFDRDKSGSIDASELTNSFNKLDFRVNRSVLAAIVRRYGGRNNKITLEDFVIIITKLLVMYYIFKEHKIQPSVHDSPAQFTLNEFLQYAMFL